MRDFSFVCVRRLARNALFLRQKQRDGLAFLALDIRFIGLLEIVSLNGRIRGGPSLTLFTRDDLPDRMVRFETGAEFLAPAQVVVGGDVFGADAGKRLQQKLADVAEGDRLLLRDAALSHEQKYLRQCAIDAGSVGEIGAKLSEDGVRAAFGG